MIQRGIGIIIGGVVTLIVLMLMVNNEEWSTFVPAIIIGGLAAFFWPVVIGFVLGRRARARQEARIESEVQRQLNDERRHRG